MAMSASARRPLLVETSGPSISPYGGPLLTLLLRVTIAGLSNMKQGAWLVNTARGTIVERDALV